MAGDLTNALKQVQIDDPRFKTALAFQTYRRSLNEAAILKLGPGGEVQTLGVAVGSYGIDINESRVKAAIAKLEKLPDNASVDQKRPTAFPY